ncbi:hypothetical protein [Mitsuaria sp. 7]|uniref:hypothetical protein n=1 Tax=Mitsuaria sp. 7 TaxID=1658665 RepID=UPI0012F8815D|nr:hypothetical protein [Mitsuaria sp. 7]
MWNDSFNVRFAGPYRSEVMQDDLDECRGGSAPSRHCLDVGHHDRVDYRRVLPHVDRLCQGAARYRDRSSGEWQRQWNDCVFRWDQWAALIRSDREGYQRELGGARGATGVTASNLGHDYRAFLALEARWLRCASPSALPAPLLSDAGRRSTGRPSMPSITTACSSALIPSAPPLSMDSIATPLPPRLIPSAPPPSISGMSWRDEFVCGPPPDVSGQDPLPGRSSFRP